MAPAQGGTFSAADFRLVEDLGFDYLALGEHLMFHVPVPNGIVGLSFAAACTERIALLSAVTLVPLYPPALLAKMSASLDVLSNGRFNLGVGVGGEYPTEFDAVGIPVGERGARTDEALEVITALWSGEEVEFDGRFTRFRGGRIRPAPVARPRPPIWIAGRSEAAARRAARFGEVWMPYLYSPEQFAASVTLVRAASEERGREQAPPASLCCFLSTHADGTRARREVTHVVGGTYEQDFSSIGARYLIAGTPGECAERLQEYVDAGTQGAIFILACAHDEFASMARRLREEVIPALAAA
jgi:probable F420-dependent oxidoreductase